MDENSTPNVTVDKAFGKRIIAGDTIDLGVQVRYSMKCNLKEIYDVDEYEDGCSSKSKSSHGLLEDQSGKSEQGSSKSGAEKTLDIELIQHIKDLLYGENPFVKVYRMVKNTIQDDHHVKLNLQLIGKRDKDGRTHDKSEFELESYNSSCD
ncbi:hypothetical protein QVD17_30874 [Tagetes erecta]|uniref:Uncharacterized protein n=1 Tax=Tagetes erecta TaxID=13708 RepID=A0AAD8K4F8_TARER|nr:hypothetical protein QVD17_30874 [Tagetes erecta]